MFRVKSYSILDYLLACVAKTNVSDIFWRCFFTDVAALWESPKPKKASKTIPRVARNQGFAKIGKTRLGRHFGLILDVFSGDMFDAFVFFCASMC